jgi:hypothetical protein
MGMIGAVAARSVSAVRGSLQRCQQVFLHSRAGRVELANEATLLTALLDLNPDLLNLAPHH